MQKINQSQRLQKIIASSGFCSRRKAELLILNGKVKVNDQIVTTLGTKVFSSDSIKINDQILHFNDYLYLVFYKPINCLTTLKDPQKRPTIMNYFTDLKIRIYPVGRLDFDTSGLLLITNDGDFSQQVLHPKYKINKIYQVTCLGILSLKQIKQLEKGIEIAKNITTAKAKIKVIKIDNKKQQTIINLTIHQGYKNQVKLMLLAVGSKVLNLKRIAIENINLKGLEPGKYRILSESEKNALLKLANKAN